MSAPSNRHMANFRVAELFAGIGGVTGGFLDAGGFDPVVLHDCDADAKSTFRTNFPDLGDRYHIGRVEALSGPELLDLAGGEIDGLLGCPPCQGFSPAGLRDEGDKRNRILNEFLRLLKSTEPKFFVMENVPSLLQSTLYREFRRVACRNYVLHAEVVNAAEYGVPQLRRRAIVVGFRKDLCVEPSLPRPTHGGSGKVYDYASGKYVRPHTQWGRNSLKLRPQVRFPPKKLVNLYDSIADLPTELNFGDEPREYRSPASTPYQRRMRRSARALMNHRAWRHGRETIELMRRVAPGSCPLQYGGRSRNEVYFSQAYARLHKLGLARTITTNFHNPGSGRFTHYAVPRTLTLREALRVQSFPDDFHFNLEDLHPSDAERLVGNAFPRLFAEAIARHVRKLLIR